MRMQMVLAVFFACCGVSPAADSFRLVRLVYDNSSGEKGTTFFDYGPDGRSGRALWELDNGSRFSLNTHTYDARGNLIEKSREYSDRKDTVQRMTWDAAGRQLTEEFLLLGASRGVSTFEYDEAGRLRRILCKAYQGWIDGVLRFDYDERGVRTRGELQQKDARAAAIVYRYDGRGLLVREEWDFNGGWKQVFQYEYEPAPTAGVSYTTANPFLPAALPEIAREIYRYGDSPESPSHYRYGAGGKLLEKAYTRSDGLSTRTFYLYSGDGQLQRAFRRFSDGRSALFRFRFDSARRLVARDFFTSDKRTGSESYRHTAAGVLQSAEFVNSDFWLTGSLAFESSADGRLSKGSFQGAKGEKAAIGFAYDAGGRLTGIDWRFADGLSQTYRFEYAP